jgi:hypothetical protein
MSGMAVKAGGAATTPAAAGGFACNAHHDTPPLAASTITAARTSGRRIERGVAVDTAKGDDTSPDCAPPMAAANCATSPKRSAGFFASARRTAATTGVGMPGRSYVMGGASAIMCWCTTLAAVGPVKGGCPANISNTTHASAY